MMGCVFSNIKKFFETKEEKEKRKIKAMLQILRREAYFWYLKKIKSDVDLPDFLYYTGETIDLTALQLANEAIKNAQKQGNKHIKRCFKKLLQAHI